MAANFTQSRSTMKLLRSVLVAFAGLLVVGSVHAVPHNSPPSSAAPVNQVFQFMQSGTCTAWSAGQPSQVTSYLWIPENCQRVRGLLILCANLPEHRLVGHVIIRRVRAANDLATVWSTPSFMNFKCAEPAIKMAKIVQQTLKISVT
jgi:hypothetical protein